MCDSYGNQLSDLAARGLEVLDNYRVSRHNIQNPLMADHLQILNLNGFCKALKKFEKVTLLPASSVYMEEKVYNLIFYVISVI